VPTSLVSREGFVSASKMEAWALYPSKGRDSVGIPPLTWGRNGREWTPPPKPFWLWQESIHQGSAFMTERPPIWPPHLPTVGIWDSVSNTWILEGTFNQLPHISRITWQLLFYVKTCFLMFFPLSNGLCEIRVKDTYENPHNCLHQWFFKMKSLKQVH
jgi:hypothetical protein